MSTDRLKNVGPKSAAWLRQVGVRSMDDLAALGAVGAFIKVKRAGFKPSLNLLYALEGALIGCHWQQVPEDRRQQLLTEAEAESALLPLPKGKRKPVGGEVRDVTPGGATPPSNSDDMDVGGGEAEMSFGFDDPSSDSSHDRDD